MIISKAGMKEHGRYVLTTVYGHDACMHVCVCRGEGGGGGVFVGVSCVWANVCLSFA